MSEMSWEPPLEEDDQEECFIPFTQSEVCNEREALLNPSKTSSKQFSTITKFGSDPQSKNSHTKNQHSRLILSKSWTKLRCNTDKKCEVTRKKRALSQIIDSFESEVGESFSATPSSRQNHLSNNSHSVNLACSDADIKENVDRSSQCSSGSTGGDKRHCVHHLSNSSHSSLPSSQQTRFLESAIQIDHVFENDPIGHQSNMGNDLGTHHDMLLLSAVEGAQTQGINTYEANPSEAAASDSIHQGMSPSTVFESREPVG
eukprot:612613-Hanusia_phi.AAC.1